MPPVALSSRDARRVQLAAQGLLGPRLRGGPAEVVARTRGVQLDTISVLARSHELVAYARLGALPPRRIEAAYWGGPPHRFFEYWYHAVCIVPIEEWPNLAFKRRAVRERGFRWHRPADPERECKLVLERVREEGPLTANELGGAKRGGTWWDWSDTKIAAEWLLGVGDLVCVSRRAYQRVYDLPERAIPSEHQHDVGRRTAIVALLERAASALGVSTVRDLACYVGLKQDEVKAALPETSLAPATVEGWRQTAWIGGSALEQLEAVAGARGRPRLISPFDSLASDRARLERVFQFVHRLEAYVPKAKRRYGYYSMPLLANDRLVARVDPARSGTTLVARSVDLEDGVELERGARAIAAALWDAARWVRADSITLERVTPPALARPLSALIAG